MKRIRVHIEQTTGGIYRVLNDSKELLYNGTMPECQSFVTDFERAQDAKGHKKLASGYFTLSAISFFFGFGLYLFDADTDKIVISCTISILLMILSEGHNAKC